MAQVTGRRRRHVAPLAPLAPLALRQLLLLLLAAPLPAAASYYWVYPGRDAPYQDYAQYANLTVAQLEAVCDADARCLAFNGGGFLKNNISAFCPAATTLWIKQLTPQPPPPRVFLWPLPRSLTLPGDGEPASVPLASSFAITSSSAPSADLDAARARALRNVLYHGVPSTAPSAAPPAARLQPQLPSLDVFVEDVAVPLALGVNESYSLVVSADGSAATLSAATLFGAYAGLETFAQLVSYSFDEDAYSAAVARVADSPAYSWRGLMLDAARHFLPVPFLEATVDALAAAKANVLHLHLSDWQSISVSCAAAPAIAQGAFSSQERYLPRELSSLAEYGRARGVRVVPELDTPGHADSWCVGAPDVCPNAFCTSPLAPYERTFEVVGSLLQMLADAFPDAFVHQGGDEVDVTCWATDPGVAAWRLANGNLTLQQTLEYFAQRTGNISAAMGGRQTVRWHDLWSRGVPLPRESTVYQVWEDSSVVANVTADGFRALYSSDAAWYLDHEGITWRTAYDADPRANITDAGQRALVLGGEATAFGERLDPSNLESVVWPRAAAVFERLWSDGAPGAASSSGVEVEPRLQAFRCLLLRRGVRAGSEWAPVAGGLLTDATSCLYA